MTAGALHSDHVNYLVFRYLQEAGHEKTATAFYRDWRRPQEYRNPENLPFASNVHRHELVSVIQDGLRYDEIRTSLQKDGRRFRWVVSPDQRNGDALENGATVSSRPSSRAAKRKPRAPHRDMRAPDEFPTPASKRHKTGDGWETIHVNGDLMDVDGDAASPSAGDDEDGDVASPAVPSEEPYMIEVPERYDSMDVAVQTEVKARPKTSTMSWTIDKADATILHSIFNPSAQKEAASTLLTVGDALCQLYQVPETFQDANAILGIDEPSIPTNSFVGAAAWHPDGGSAAFAVDHPRKSQRLENGIDAEKQTVFYYERKTGRSVICSNPPLMEPSEAVLAIRYSADGKYILVVRTNLRRGSVLLYDTSTPDASVVQPVAWRLLERPVLDATWTSSTTFLVGGDGGLLEYFALQIPTADHLPEEGHSYSIDRLTVSGPTFTHTWEKVRYDAPSNTVVAAARESCKLAIGSFTRTSPDDAEHSITFADPIDISANLTALAFRPLSITKKGDEASLLAVAFQDGTCSIYTFGDAADHSHEQLMSSLSLEHGPALALAWSPEGSHLAVGNTELVQIWDEEALQKGGDRRRGPLVVWRPEQTDRSSDYRNGEPLGEDKPLLEPSLSWSSDGETLNFAVDRQLAVIRFRPPLHAIEQGAQVDGHGSP